jgi:hypothetical protein
MKNQSKRSLQLTPQDFPYGVPVICLDDFRRIGTRNDLELKNSPAQDVTINFFVTSSQDPNFLKFMDWCIHVSDRKLAHIVFVTSHTFLQCDLDSRNPLLCHTDVITRFCISNPTISDQLRLC